MSTKIKLKIGQVIAPNFSTSLSILADDKSLPIKSRWAVANLLKDIRSNVETYETERSKLIREHGEIETIDLLKRLLPYQQTQQDVSVMKFLISQHEQAAADNKPAPESHRIDISNPDKAKAFFTQLAELHAVEFETCLTEKIALADGSNLTAREIDALEAIVTFNA